MNPTASDRIAYRDHLRSLVNLTDAKLVVDLGCGTGHDLQAMADSTRDRHDIEFVGIDVAEKNVLAGRKLTSSDQRVKFLHKKIATDLPFQNDSVDVVYSNNFLECVSDRQALLTCPPKTEPE